MWILGLGGLRGMDLTRLGYINPAIEQKPAACCVVFKSNLPLPKHYILLRIPKRLIEDNLLFTAVYLKKGPDSAFVTFIIYFIFILDTTNKRHFLKMELT